MPSTECVFVTPGSPLASRFATLLGLLAPREVPSAIGKLAVICRVVSVRLPSQQQSAFRGWRSLESNGN